MCKMCNVKMCKLHVLHIKLSFTLKGDVSDLTHSWKMGPVGPLYLEQSLKHIKMSFWTYFDFFLTGALPHFFGHRFLTKQVPQVFKDV